MEAEVREIRDHLTRFPPFDGLSEDLLDDVATSVEIAYHQANPSIRSPISAVVPWKSITTTVSYIIDSVKAISSVSSACYVNGAYSFLLQRSKTPCCT